MSKQRTPDFLSMPHDARDPSPWRALYLDQSTPIDEAVKHAWLVDSSSASRQYLLPFIRPFARSLIILFPLGCSLDVLSGTVLGLHSILCFGGYFLLRFISGKLPVLESLYQIPLVATSFLAVNWCAHVVVSAFDEELLLP